MAAVADAVRQLTAAKSAPTFVLRAKRYSRIETVGIEALKASSSALWSLLDGTVLAWGSR
jgi:hypothetical protein